MSKKQFRSQASSGRAAFGAGASFGNSFGGSPFGSSSPLSWIAEPPDLSGFSDPNVAVSFKNLSKKDSTTKAKALEDLQSYVAAPDHQVEEAVLEAWVKIYPRLSIDSERRVRQLAHNLQGSVASRSGKRIARHMPKIAGPWLAGAQDGDRAAARAAQDALKLVFNSPEKLQNVGKAFQQPILEYCRDALLNESVQTLSDERAVSKDDAEATYARVVATSIAVISNLLQDLSLEEAAKQQETYEAVISERKIWEFAVFKDVVVRRYVHRLLRACLSKQRAAVEANLQTITKAYIDKALNSDQAGSTPDLIQALVDLTDALPQAWTSSYDGKKAASERLRQGLKRGSQSQSGSNEFWIAVWTLFTKLPSDALPKAHADIKKFLSSVREGVCLREERFSASAAWDTYFRIVDLLLMSPSLSQDELSSLVQEMALPVVQQYIDPSAENIAWSITGAKSYMVVSKVTLVRQVPALLEQKWPEYASKLIHGIKTSAPEQSKDYEKSQTAVAQAGSRWALLQAELLHIERAASSSLREVFRSTAKAIVQESLDLLRARNGKPYGAAAIVDELLNHCNDMLLEDRDTYTTISTFVVEEVPQLVFSPSQRQLISLLYHFKAHEDFTTAWNSVASSLANTPDSSEKFSAFRSFLASPRVNPAVEHAAGNPDIQAFLQRQYQLCIGSGEQWSFLAGAIRAKPSVASTETTDAILADLTGSLSISDKAVSALQGLEEISAGNRDVVKNFIAKPSGGQLLPNILHLQESPDDAVSAKATAVGKRIVDDVDKSSSQAILFDVVHQSLNHVSADSLPIASVLEMATNVIGESDVGSKKLDIAKQALPSQEKWREALAPFLGRIAPSSQAITSLVGGAVYLIQPQEGATNNRIHRDAEGFSQALRYAFYTARIFSNRQLLEALDVDLRTSLFELLSLTHTLIHDGVNLSGPVGLSSVPDSELEVPLSKYQNEVDRLISEFIFDYNDASNLSAYSFVGHAIDTFLASSEKGGPEAFYNAEALSYILAEVHSAHGSSHGKVQEYEERALQSYKAREALPFIACVSGLSGAIISSKRLDRQVNELVADLTGLKIAEASDRALAQLVMLNALLLYRDAGSTVAKQRLVFLMKHVLLWLDDPTASILIKAECCKLLCAVLPSVSDIYGEHWAEILSFAISAWSSRFADVETQSLDHSNMVLVHHTLRLYGVLRSLTTVEDPNDDLLDTWKEHEDKAYQGLISLLKASNGVPDGSYLPLNATFAQLAQELNSWQRAKANDAEELYPLLYAESRPLQQQAFNILHTHIPSMQEQISFDAALENKTAQLPEELLSLILEAPDFDAVDIPSLGKELPRDLQGYLYSWQLVFDHFSNASYKVKSDYIDGLKEGDHLPGLLNLTYEVLGHNRGKPVDVSKFDITRYDYIEQEDFQSETDLSTERRLRWLLAHLFYQCLTHLPSLTKAHYLTINRQAALAVESWTAKFIAPLIINESLSSVATWAATSAKDDPDYENLTVKVSMRSREVNVSYLVDEQNMAIVVRLPEDYPLTGAKVEGVNRVAVGEKKWQSWLRNSQGVITFSNGNLVDGLSTWRKNVTGALKGQTECAICYSIISGDKQLPSKRCGTCKNLFHSSCLFKWFKTSNASSCPLCRNPFNYG